MKPAVVLVAIVNYRTPDLAVAAIGSIAAEVTTRGDTHVVVVDNGSGDGSAERIAAAIAQAGHGGWCNLLAVTDNRGFAAGNNAAIRWHQAQTGTLPDYVWLLNPDTIAEPDAIGALLRFLADRPDVGIAGGRCLWEDGGVWTSAFRFPSPQSELLEAVHLGLLNRLVAGHIVGLPAGETPTPADWVSGASMMIRRAVIERVGLMDEGYFLYFEETDYCARARAAGFAVWSVPASRITHIGGQATGVTGKVARPRRRPRYWFESRARFFRYRYGVFKTHLANLLWLGGYPVGGMIARLRGSPRHDPPRLWRDFLRANYGRGGIMYQARTVAKEA